MTDLVRTQRRSWIVHRGPWSVVRGPWSVERRSCAPSFVVRLHGGRSHAVVVGHTTEPPPRPPALRRRKRVGSVCSVGPWSAVRRASGRGHDAREIPQGGPGGPPSIPSPLDPPSSRVAGLCCPGCAGWAWSLSVEGQTSRPVPHSSCVETLSSAPLSRRRRFPRGHDAREYTARIRMSARNTLAPRSSFLVPPPVPSPLMKSTN
jgi:hypothetical protein